MTCDELKAKLTEDLEIYTVVVMAKLDLEKGNFESAIKRLKVDADKIRTHDMDLYNLIMSY
jgi:hypothetical protein